MIITQSQLLRAVPTLYKPRLDEFVAYFNQWAEPFEVNTPLRVVHFLSQCFHESGNLRYCEENLNYSAEGLLKTFPKYFKTRKEADAYARQPEKIANRVYGGRMGNGPEASGDGWKYRGRGFIGLTGKSNYIDYSSSEFCIGDVVKNPDLIAKAPGNLKTALYFWWKNGCNKWADLDDCEGLTRRINGGQNGLANRKYLLRCFKREYGIKNT